MENLVLLPTLAQKRRSDFNQYAEEATIISEETTKVKKGLYRYCPWIKVRAANQNIMVQR